MKVTAWNNGSRSASGAGYGLEVTKKDRDIYFKREWQHILLSLLDNSAPIKVNIDKDSFWNDTCRELIAKEIGMWLLSEKHAPWTKGCPPKFELAHTNSNSFAIR